MVFIFFGPPTHTAFSSPPPPASEAVTTSHITTGRAPAIRAISTLKKFMSTLTSQPGADKVTAALSRAPHVALCFRLMLARSELSDAI